MVLVFLIVAFVIFSTLLVVAAGILSSRLSRQEEWYETYELVEAESAETIPQATE